MVELTPEQWQLVADQLPLINNVARRLERLYPYSGGQVYDACLDSACRAARHFDPAKARFSTYLFRAFKWAGMDCRKASARRAQRFDAAMVLEDVRDLPASPVSRFELSDEIEALPEDIRDVARLRFLGELEMRAIADYAGLSLGAVHKLCQLAKEELRERLAG